MNRNVPVPSGWEARDATPREVGSASLATMADTGEIDLRRFIRTVYQGKWILILTIFAIMSATMYWLLHSVPLYNADVLIVIDSYPSRIVKIDEAVQDSRDDAARVNTEVAVLQSRTLAARVIEELGLDKDPEFAPDEVGGGTGSTMVAALQSARAFLTSAWARDDGGSAPDGEMGAPGAPHGAALPGAAETRERTALLDRFLARLSVESEDRSRLIRIGFTSVDPAKAALIANRLVDDYLENQLETKTEGARRTAEWLEQRLAEVGENVRSLERSVQLQRAESGLGGGSGVNSVEQRLARWNVDLVAARAASVATKARYDRARAVLRGGGPVEALLSVIASSTIQALRAERAELTGHLSALRADYGDRHPEVVSTLAKIDELDQQLDREVENVLAGLRDELETARMHESAVQSEFESVGEEMVRVGEAEAAVGYTAEKLAATRDLYQNLLKRYTETVALRDNQQPDARVISPAQIPLEPSYPNVPRVMALSFVGSISFGVLLLVVTERLRQKLNTVEDVERHVGLQIIGAIPDLPRLRRLTSAPGDYMQREPLSEFGSAFQRLRALLALGNDRRMPHAVLVTSASAGEGKTTIAVCLAIASVSSGQRVLLVDCDFSRPRVHRVLDVNNDVGLTDVLKGTATFEEAITDAAGYSLSIMTVGGSRHGFIDLLNSGRMEQVLTALQRRYDIIIIDSAPVLEASDALILGGLAEKTILVTRRKSTTRRRAADAAKQLQLYGADLAGAVFNRTGAAGDRRAYH